MKMEDNKLSADNLPKEAKPKDRSLLRNIAILVAAAGLFAVLYFTVPGFNYGVRYTVDAVSHGDLEKLKEYLRSFGIWAPLVSALIMILQSVIAPLPGLVVTLTNGLLFGAFWGTLLSWSSSMAGAVVCFYIARMLGRPAVERLVNKKALGRVDHFFERYGNNSVLMARLLPVVSFHAVSYAAGLTPITFWGFFWASAIGELPATIVYSWVGQNLSNIGKVGLWAFVSLAALLVLGITIKQALDKRITNRQKKMGEKSTAIVGHADDIVK